jgi:hypothetical protein
MSLDNIMLRSLNLHGNLADTSPGRTNSTRSTVTSEDGSKNDSPKSVDTIATSVDIPRHNMDSQLAEEFSTKPVTAPSGIPDISANTRLLNLLKSLRDISSSNPVEVRLDAADRSRQFTGQRGLYRGALRSPTPPSCSIAFGGRRNESGQGELLSTQSYRQITAGPIFRPMHAVRAMETGSSLQYFNIDSPLNHEAGAFSPNYLGDRSLARNRSADIPDEENCSVWITGLPPRTTHNQLLSEIRGVGRVYATVINPPDPDHGHTTAAAKVVFFTLASAHEFYAKAHRERFIINGYTTRVSWNRIKSAEHPNPGDRSRVLMLQGAPEFVNERSLTVWFLERFTFEIDKVIERNVTSNLAIVEYRFGSYRCQAEAAKMALAREKSDVVWNLRYGEDPCAM